MGRSPLCGFGRSGSGGFDVRFHATWSGARAETRRDGFVRGETTGGYPRGARRVGELFARHARPVDLAALRGFSECFPKASQRIRSLPSYRLARSHSTMSDERQDCSSRFGFPTLCSMNEQARLLKHTDGLPQADRDVEHMQGHWVLARLGKRVLRPGGEGLTKRMLAHAPTAGRKVVEFAPGLGRTTRLIMQDGPSAYTGVDRDGQVAAIIGPLVKPIGGTCLNADAADTGLPDGGADVVVGEAMLTMQSERGKRAVIAEARRILKPGGLYAIHEMGLTPDDVPDGVKDAVRRDLAKAIRVNARPLTDGEWRALLEAEGFEVVWSGGAPMALLGVRRNIMDEGVGGVLRIMRNLLTHPDLRARVLDMRRVFAKYGDTLDGVAFVARRKD